MSTELIKADEKTIIAIEEACEQCNLARLATLSPIRRTLALANGMQLIRKHLVGPLMKDIMALANTPLGFMTDRPPGATDREGKPLKPYSEDVIRDCVIEGMLRGASIVGNEINVLAFRCYLTKNYFERAVREWPGLTDFALREGVPVLSSSAGGALVAMSATWKLNGVQQQLRCDHGSDGDFRIPVRVNSGMGADAILGKAKRKFCARVYAMLTGSSWIAEQADMDGSTVEGEAVAGNLPEPAAEASTAAPAAEEETAAEILFRGIETILLGMEQISDVDQYQANAAGLLKEEDDLAKLNEWCEWRRTAIRESRGPKSNGKG